MSLPVLYSREIFQTASKMLNHPVPTVLIQVGSSHRIEGVDCALESLHNIKEALPELWEANDKSEGIKYSKKVAIETSVEA
jgi:hypothetical protein